MKNQIVFFLFSLLALEPKGNAYVNPRALVDEVIAQLDQLESTVEGNILAGHSGLGNRETDFLTNNNNVLVNGGITIDEQQTSISETLAEIKELAAAVNADISTCVTVRELVLNRIPGEYKDQLRSCIFDKNAQEAQQLTTSRYVIDITINKVHNLRFQVTQCGGDLNCLSPLLTEIELDKVRLPQNIQTELNAFDSLLEGLRVLVQDCSDSNVSQYTAQSTSIIGDITACVNRVLG